MAPPRFDDPVALPPGPFPRRATRYEVTRREASLAWRERRGSRPRPVPFGADSSPRHHFALLVDISRVGASLVTDRSPEEGTHVWLRLEADWLGEWTEARVVGVTTTARGPDLVRLAFRAPCSPETLRAAIWG